MNWDNFIGSNVEVERRWLPMLMDAHDFVSSPQNMPLLQSKYRRNRKKGTWTQCSVFARWLAQSVSTYNLIKGLHHPGAPKN